MEVYILLLVFGITILIAAVSLCFSRDPRKSILMYKVAGKKKMSLEEARKSGRQIASALLGVSLALILFSIIMLVRSA